MNLAEIALKQPVIIEQISGEHNLRCHLLDMGLIPGTVVSIQKAAPMGDPIELLVRGYRLTLRKADVSEITVSPIAKEAQV